MQQCNRFLISDTDLIYAILGLSEWGTFNLIIGCAKREVLQGNLVLNQPKSLSSDNLGLLHFNVNDDYQRVQPDYGNIISPQSFAQSNDNYSKLLGEINSIKN